MRKKKKNETINKTDLDVAAIKIVLQKNMNHQDGNYQAHFN